MQILYLSSLDIQSYENYLQHTQRFKLTIGTFNYSFDLHRQVINRVVITRIDKYVL
jgi:hypothetical protein